MKGAVAEISGAKAIMLTDDGEFVTIKNKKYSVGQRVVIAKRNYSRFSAIAACFLLFFMLGGGVWGYYTPVSYVDIDINPSIRLELNILDHVIGVTPLNDDGEVFLENAGELPEDVEECISEIIEQATKQGYIHDDNRDVYVYSVSSGKNITDKLSRCAQNNSENDNVNVYTESENEETFKEAKKHNSSMGRIKLIEEYGELAGGTLDENVKAFKDKPNKKIREAIKEHKKPDEPLEQDTGAEPEKHSGRENEQHKQQDIEYEKPKKKESNVSSNKQKEQPEKSEDMQVVKPEITEMPEKKQEINPDEKQQPENNRELHPDNGRKEVNEQAPQNQGTDEEPLHKGKTLLDRKSEIPNGTERNEEINTGPNDNIVNPAP